MSMTNKPERSVEEIVEEFHNGFEEELNPVLHQYINVFLTQTLQTERQRCEEMVEEALAEYRQFVLNVLDGVDIADGQCNTKAIRFALQSRVITQQPTPLTNDKE